jgi:hypothetical protein
MIQLLILNEHLYLSGVWLGVDLSTDTRGHHVCKRDWTTCSKFVNLSKLNSQHNWGTDLHGHFMSSRILTLKMMKIFI